MKMIHIEDGVNGYVDLVHHVRRHGHAVSPRGFKTLEIEDAVIRIDNIYPTLPVGVGRNPVAGIGAVEACQLLAGQSRPSLVIAVGPQFKHYAEDDGKFYGSYGERTDGQYDAVIQKLAADLSSRQAVVTMWNASLDNEPGKRDYPCTVMHQFRVRNNRLNMSVYMRSNDVWLGAAYDFFQFTRVQIAMCSVLGVEPGEYCHHVGSLHLYENNFEASEALTKTKKIPAIPPITGWSWASIKSSASLILDATSSQEAYDMLTTSEKWYADAMISAIAKNAGKPEDG